MSEISKLNKDSLVDPPVHPCIKGDGLCKLRTRDDVHFDCALAIPCPFNKKGVAKQEELFEELFTE